MLELNKIYHGDCMELMKKLPDKSIDVVITDPPYGILGGNKSIGGNKPIAGGSKLYKANEYNLEWDNERMSEEVFKEFQRISRHQIIFGYNYFADFLPPTNALIVWDKKEKNNWFDNFSDGEIIWTSYKKPLRIYRQLWMGALRRGERTKRLHPTQKPVELMEWIIKNYTEEGQIILDPFLGSGTTAIACINTNRFYIGIEKEKKYVDIANKRIEEHIKKLQRNCSKKSSYKRC